MPKLQERCIKAFPEVPDLIHVYRALCGYYTIPIGGGEGAAFDLDYRTFVNKYQLDPVHTYHCLESLERDGWIMLNEAIYHPSTVYISTSHDTLEEFQAQNIHLGQLLKTLLRNYEGLFLEPVRIREQDLARLLNTKTESIGEELTILDKEGIITYTPATELPRVTFLRERVEDRNLTFDKALITRLRNQALARVQSVEHYITSETCREQNLLAYFGEKGREVCGSCDICRSKRKNISYDAILLRIPETGIALKELLGGFSATDQPEVRELLSVLESSRSLRTTSRKSSESALSMMVKSGLRPAASAYILSSLLAVA